MQYGFHGEVKQGAWFSRGSAVTMQPHILSDLKKYKRLAIQAKTIIMEEKELREGRNSICGFYLPYFQLYLQH